MNELELAPFILYGYILGIMQANEKASEAISKIDGMKTHPREHKQSSGHMIGEENARYVLRVEY